MRITSLFSLNAIALEVAASNQDEIIDEVVALAAGSIVGAVILSLLKKTRTE